MYSLKRRLLISATLLLLLFLGVMGVVLNRSFEQSVLSNAQDALRNQVLLMIANIDVIDSNIVVPSLLSEPRLSQIDSDLFAQISVHNEGEKTIVWRSRSLLDKKLPQQRSQLGSFLFFDSIDPDPKEWGTSASLFITTLGVEWETDDGDFPFTVEVAEYSTSYLNSLSKYQRQVHLSLLILGAVLITLLLSLLGWALKPLNRVALQVGEIEQGHRQRFDEDYPLEVSRLTQNLNQLLSYEEQQISRQKEVLGNLAHSLKTPIAVLNGLTFSKDVGADAKQQISYMQAIIDYQLQSASAVGRRRFTKPIQIKTLTTRIIDSLQKVHREKELECQLEIMPETQFFGDEGDWMELTGNLLDNAFKWANSTIKVNVENIKLNNSESTRQGVRLSVDDDGPGIDKDLRNSILERGVRLDSQSPGHGIGLHIVKGIVDAYQGEMHVGFSDQTKDNIGTQFVITLK